MSIAVVSCARPVKTPLFSRPNLRVHVLKPTLGFLPPTLSPDGIWLLVYADIPNSRLPIRYCSRDEAGRPSFDRDFGHSPSHSTTV